MMGVLWVVLLVALTGSHLGNGLPLGTPRPWILGLLEQSDKTGADELSWRDPRGVYAVMPALGLLLALVGLLLGCTWCYNRRSCELFTERAAQDVARPAPVAGFAEPTNNNLSEDNNNGPISLREMQNIANNNAAAYITSENEERNRARASRESVVEFEPLPADLPALPAVPDPLERCSDWFEAEDFPRDRLQYLREIGRGWFGRIVEGEIEETEGSPSTPVAVKILKQNASPVERARFLDESRIYRQEARDGVLRCLARSLRTEPWILVFELCSMDLQQYLQENRPKMASLNESGVPLRLQCDVALALAYLHSQGILYGNLWSGNVLVRGSGEGARCVLGRYQEQPPPHDIHAPELHHRAIHTVNSEVWSLGILLWEVCSWGVSPSQVPMTEPALPCPYRAHLYQVQQLCWNANPELRPSAAQVHSLLDHLFITHQRSNDLTQDDGYGSSDFEERWQRLKPNSIPKLDEHVAIVHAPSTSTASHFTGSEHEYDNSTTIQDTLSVDMDTAVSRSSSIMSDKDPLSVQIKSESMTNLHGSLDDVRNIYLTHNENPLIECHQANLSFEDAKEKEQDRSDSSMDPWVKDIIAGSQDDVSYFKDVSDVIKNLDNILNSEKTSSSESSHQASPSRDNLSLDCKKEYTMQSSLVKSPGISNFQNILDGGFADEVNEQTPDEDGDRETIGTLSHSFERHSDTNSQHTLENLTPDTPIKDICDIENQIGPVEESVHSYRDVVENISEIPPRPIGIEVASVISNEVPKLKELCLEIRLSEGKEQCNTTEELKSSCDSFIRSERTDTRDNIPTKSEIEEALVKEVSDETTAVISENIVKEELEIESSHNPPLEQKYLKIGDDDRLIIKADATCGALTLPILVKANEAKTEPFESPQLYLISPEESARITDSSLDGDASAVISKEIDVASAILVVPEEIVTSSVSKSLKSPQVDKTISEKITTMADSAVIDKDSSMPNKDVGVTLAAPIDSEIVGNKEVGESQADEIKLAENLNNTKKESFIDDSIVVSDSEALSNNVKVPVNQGIEEIYDSPKQKEKIVEDFGHQSEQIPKIEINPVKTIQGTPQKEAELLYGLNESIEQAEVQPALPFEIQGIIQYVGKDEDQFEVQVTVEAINENMHAPPKSLSDTEPTSDQFEISELPEENKDKSGSDSLETHSLDTQSTLPLGKSNIVQNIETETSGLQYSNEIRTNVDEAELVVYNLSETGLPNTEASGIDESTVYMDLINNTNNSAITNQNHSNVQDFIKSCVEQSSAENSTECTMVNNESTVYMDLPNVMDQTHNFLVSERGQVKPEFNEGQFIEATSSTPKGSDAEETAEKTVLQSSMKSEDLSEHRSLEQNTTVPKEQRYVPDVLSPFDSPTKSHPTDTYDENSSVVLGPFENCSTELFKGIKSAYTEIDVPKEELLAFSSNFSEINLETPSPLRDQNFLIEVPDIEINEELIFDDLNAISEPKSSEKTEVTQPFARDNIDGNSESDKPRSPSTPPNSPGIFLASTSQQKYLVDIDLNPSVDTGHPSHESDSGVSSMQKEIDLNQIELHITTKLAMAENENNLNIEYSGPLTVEGLVTDDAMSLRDSDAIPESFLAGNGGSVLVEEPRESFALDEECMAALRNELELKLPLAQVASIEPSEDVPAWTAPELIVNYPGALSPIMEETGNQLSAYENDRIWNASARTDSSESYLEPCNNSTDSVTELPTTGQASGQHDSCTYTVNNEADQHSLDNHTYTVQKDHTTSRDLTMSADSLNGSPARKVAVDKAKSPINDHTYNKEEEKESCDRISQVSPFLMSPTTETSVPEHTDVTGISTLSKTTVPTDAKASKPSDTQCLSKATSIDSWCSNDTLFNVEDNFDDLVMDADVHLQFEGENEEHSDSSDTLTHNDDEKEHSHCSTHIVHESKSDACETFSPDSITAHCTYTKMKSETTDKESPVAITKSDVNDSFTKNTQTKDLAYGTLVSGLASYSNCTTELYSGTDNLWKVPPPELVRRSPVGVDQVIITPPKIAERKELIEASPQSQQEWSVKKMDSVDITCLDDNHANVDDEMRSSVTSQPLSVTNDSPGYHMRNMACSVQSTPILETVLDESSEAIPMPLPDSTNTDPNFILPSHLPNFQNFFNSVELRPQDTSPRDMSPQAMSSNQDTALLLEGETSTFNKSSKVQEDRTPTYSDFEDSAMYRAQDVASKTMSSANSTEEFQIFENSVRSKPQDLSAVDNTNSLLLKSEGKSSEFPGSTTNIEMDQTTQNSNAGYDPNSRLIESPIISNNTTTSPLIPQIIETNADEDDNEQPHSIIITDISPQNVSKDSKNATFDSHTETALRFNHTYDSHEKQNEDDTSEVKPKESANVPKVNDTGEVQPKESANDPKVNGDIDKVKKVASPTIQELTDAVSVMTPTSPVEFRITVIESVLERTEAPTGVVEFKENGSGDASKQINCNGNEANYATVNFINESFEELIESNVDASKENSKADHQHSSQKLVDESTVIQNLDAGDSERTSNEHNIEQNGVESMTVENGGAGDEETKMTLVTQDFLQNEKMFYEHDSYLPMLSDIRFTGPTSEIMSTSFSQESPSEPEAPSDETTPPPPNGAVAVADILKEWDSDSDGSQDSDPSSGEFIWKDGDGRETAVVSQTLFDHQRGGHAPPRSDPDAATERARGGSSASGDSGSGSGSGSGSEGDEVEFVPSSWDCRAAPAKSSLRSLEQAQTLSSESKKRVVFKRQKYHCVYEYPREVTAECEASPARLPDYSTYADWAAAAAEEAEISYGQIYGGHPFDMSYPLRAGVSFGSDYDEDFFISSSAHPFESLGIMSTTSQFFPGMDRLKAGALLERRESLTDDVSEDFPPPPSPLPTALPLTQAPSLDFTTPDSGVEDITPGSTAEEHFNTKKLETDVAQTQCWKSVDSGSSSESVSPSSPGGEALGGLRHTRDKLKLDLPPSPHIPSPRHSRVFNFVLDKPKPKHRQAEERPSEVATPLVMTDETPVITSALPVQKDCEDLPLPEPTFSTFGKNAQRCDDTEQMAIILTDDVPSEPTENVDAKDSADKVEDAKEGTVLDSGDEDSGIESSAKATLERNKQTPNVS